VRTLGWVGLFLVLGVGSLKFVPERAPEAEGAAETTRAGTETAASCARNFGAGFRDSVPPEFDGHIPLGKLEAASLVMCEAWVEYERTHPLTRPEDSLAAVVHEQPRIWLPFCDVTVDADLAGNAKPYRFVTKSELARYRREHCRLAVDYLQPNSILVDRARLAVDHPALYAPFCASLLQSGIGNEGLASFSRGELQTITRRSCVEALKSGAIQCGIAGFTDARVDQDRLDAILERQARNVGRA
jgi:hypothetical protein